MVWYRTGDPLVRPSRLRPWLRTTTVRRLRDFPAPTPQPTPCRLWQGIEDGHSYGLRSDGTRIYRWVWEQVHGPIPAGLSVLHRCDQPFCYRYDHLFLGTQADNVADMAAKGRGNRGKVYDRVVCPLCGRTVAVNRLTNHRCT